MTFKTLLSVAFLVLSALGAQAHSVKAGDLLIGHPWSRATPGGATVGAGYFTITNNGKTPERLLSVSTPASDKTEIHEMAMKDGVMTMRPVSAGLSIAPGATVTLAPGGLHLMLNGLKAPLKEGDRIKATLVFEKAGPVEVTINVEGMNAKHEPADKMPGMQDHKM